MPTRAHALIMLSAVTITFFLHFGIYGAHVYTLAAWYGMQPGTLITLPGGAWLLEGWYLVNGDAANTVELAEVLRGVWPWQISNNTMLNTPVYQGIMAAMASWFGWTLGFSILNIALFMSSAVLVYRISIRLVGPDRTVALMAGLLVASCPGVIAELTEPMYYIMALAIYLLFVDVVLGMDAAYPRQLPLEPALILGCILGFSRITYPHYWEFFVSLWVFFRWGWRPAAIIVCIMLIPTIAWNWWLAPWVFPSVKSQIDNANKAIIAGLVAFIGSFDVQRWTMWFAEGVGRNLTAMVYAFGPFTVVASMMGIAFARREVNAITALNICFFAATMLPLLAMQLTIPYYIGHLYYLLTHIIIVPAAIALVLLARRVSPKLLPVTVCVIMLYANSDTLFGWYQLSLAGKYGPNYWRSNAQFRGKTWPDPQRENVLNDPEFWNSMKSLQWRQLMTPAGS